MITQHEYEEAYRECRGSCSTCGKMNLDGKPLIPDAGKDLKAIYGLLCQDCSVLVRVCNDDPMRFMEIAKYVVRQMKGGHR